MNFLNKQNGITLIALVISIIVMLILAGVSINAIIGEKGILTQTKDAAMKNKLATLLEQIDIYRVSQEMENKTGLELYPIKKNDTGSLITITSKLQNGELTLSDLKSELKQYLVRKATQIDTTIVANVNDYKVYKDYYYIDENLIPAVSEFNGRVVLLIGISSYTVISLDGYDWGGSGDNSYALQISNSQSAAEELNAYSSYYAAGNNTYKLSGVGKLTVVGEKTEKLANIIGENFEKGIKELDLVSITEKFSIPTTTTANINYDCIGKNSSGNKIYVKQLLIDVINEGATVYIIDMNNDLWAWGFSGYNKLALGITGNVATPTKLLQGIQENGTQVKISKVWANGANTVVLTTQNNIYMAGCNTNGLLGQETTDSYASWVQPTIYLGVDEITSVEKYETLIGTMEDGNLKDIYLHSGANSEMSIFILYDNGKCYWKGYSSNGISGKLPATSRYVDVTELLNNDIQAVLGETYSSKDLKKIYTCYTNAFYTFRDGTFFTGGWKGSAGHGDGDNIINYAMDLDDNIISNVKDVKARDIILTNDNLYYTRTEEYEEGTTTIKKWHQKCVALKDLPTGFSFENAILLSKNYIISNNIVYEIKYNPYKVELTLEKNEELSNKNIINSKVICNMSDGNNKSGVSSKYKYVYCTTDGKFYINNVDEIYISDENSLYHSTDLGFDNTIYVSSDSENIDILLENYDYIEELDKNNKTNLIEDSAFVSKVVSSANVKYLVYNDSDDGGNYVKFKGNKRCGLCGEDFKDNIIFNRISKNSNDTLEVKQVFSSNYTKTSNSKKRCSSSVFLTNDNSVYWAGTISGGHSGFVCMKGVQYTENDYIKEDDGAVSYRYSKYPLLVENEILNSISDKIENIVFSKFDLEGGINTFSTAILTTDGNVYVYGNNGKTNGTGTNITDYALLNIGDKIKKVYSANGLMFAITENGDVYSWGYDYYNLTGKSQEFLSTPVKLPLSNVYYITIGEGFAIFATEDGKVYGIGRNEYGQLGTGNNTPATNFVECVELEK